jgi:WD40 repeat protein
VQLHDWSDGTQKFNVKAHASKKISQAVWVQNPASAASTPSNNKLFLTGSSDKTVKLWSLDTSEMSVGKARAVFKGHTGEVSSVSVHEPSGLFAVSAGLDSTWAVNDFERGVQVSRISSADVTEGKIFFFFLFYI